VIWRRKFFQSEPLLKWVLLNVQVTSAIHTSGAESLAGNLAILVCRFGSKSRKPF
jgi:hypothetical protein